MTHCSLLFLKRRVGDEFVLAQSLYITVLNRNYAHIALIYISSMPKPSCLQ